MISTLARLRRDRTKIPFDMFALARSADEARRLPKLRNIYHRGQDLAWDGQAVLPELIAKHGGLQLDERLREPLSKIFEIILWGELAAWKISAELADRLVPLEAKMAATSQAHDEARHFYVMYDYLGALGYTPTRIAPCAQRLLDLVIGTERLSEKLLGMQLMIETIALTIFQRVREARLEPVLADLLLYYEKDEARHVGLGTQYLPSLLKAQSRLEGARTLAFQLRLIFWAISSLKEMEPHLAQLGIPAADLIRLGREKQEAAFAELWDGATPRSHELVKRAIMGIENRLFHVEDRPA